MKLTVEQQYKLPVLQSQYHSCWCSVDYRGHHINRRGIGPQNHNIPYPALEELMCSANTLDMAIFRYCRRKDGIFQCCMVFGKRGSALFRHLCCERGKFSKPEICVYTLVVTWQSFNPFSIEIGMCRSIPRLLNKSPTTILLNIQYKLGRVFLYIWFQQCDLNTGWW